LRFETIDVMRTVDGIEQRVIDGQYGAILLDMNFAARTSDGSAGLDALSRILSVDPGVCVILMTAYGSVGVAVEALKRGAVDFILKPWANDKLIASVTAAVEATKAKREALAQSSIESLEKRAIQETLLRCKGNVSLAANALGLSRQALYRRLLKYGIAP
jgi:DNA-binding NtrC family response regulator